LLVAGAPVVAAIGTGAWFTEDAWARPRPSSRVYYVLNAEYGTGRHCKKNKKSDDCRGCKACRSHAANKLFPTAKAAGDHRAHKGCKCQVVKGGTLDAQAWRELFGRVKHPKRLVVDRRSKRVEKILRRAKRRARQRAGPLK
jgi:hypothetical protein